jgi:anti-sigma factor RsiW
MPSPADKSQLSARELADVSALADGTLDPARRAEVEAWVTASPDRRALYERECRVVELLHEARRAERAPSRLRARIEAERPSSRTLARRRAGYSGALAGVLAALALALALVLVLPSGTPGGPSLSQAAAIAGRGPTQPAPAPDPSAPSAQLGRNIQDVYFPNWSTRLHWRAVGQRTDRVGGRIAVTVYYQRRGERVAYTIVGVPALVEPSARVSYRNGVQLRTLTLGGRLVVTWRRDGHTCVLSGGQGASAAELQRLAAWTPPAGAR